MINKHIYIIAFFLLTSISLSIGQVKSEQYPSSVLHLGFLPQSVGATWLRDNSNFAEDSIVLDIRGIQYNSIVYSSSTAIKYFVEYQKYQENGQLLSFQLSFLQKSIDQFLFEDVVERDTTFGPDPVFPIFDGSEVKVGEKQNLQLGASFGYLWNVVNYKDRFIINIGPAIRADYYNIDYYKYDQLNETVLKTQQDGLNMGLAVQYEMTWRFAPRFSIGMNLQGNLLSHHLTFSNELNLDPDNPLNASFFRRPIANATASLRVGYYF